MKLFSLALAAMLSFSVQATEIQHPDINPDVLKELFMSSTLIQCDEKGCWDAVTKVPHETIMSGEGWAVQYDVPTLNRLEMSDEKLEPYIDPLMSLMRSVAKDLGADTDRL